jgi:hypothetical protein
MRPMRAGTLSPLAPPCTQLLLLHLGILRCFQQSKPQQHLLKPLSPVSAAGPCRYPAACAVSMSGHARGKDGMACSRGQGRPGWRQRVVHVFPGRRS